MEQAIGVGAYAYVFDASDNLWLSCTHYNGLIKYDVKAQELEYVKLFSDYDISTSHLHGAAKRIDSRLFFFPFLSNTIHIYDVISEKERTIKLPNINSEKSYFREIYENNGYFLIFPTCLNGFAFKINIDTEEVTIHQELSTIFSEYTFTEKQNSTICFSDGEMLISLPNRNEILMVDMNTYRKKVISIKINYNIQNMKKCGNYLFVTVSDSYNVYKIDLISLKIEEYCIIKKTLADRQKLAPYSDIMVLNGCIFTSNYYADQILRIDNNGVIKNIFSEMLEDIQLAIKGYIGAIYGGIISNKEKLYFVPGRASHLIEYDCKTDKCKYIEFSFTRFNNKIVETIFMNNFLKSQKEGIISLKDFMSIVYHKQQKLVASSCVGVKICERLK